ncbi:MAG: caspase family protein, partial [Treponema sp.]|nr:caspase family protein [Treponema sp.]
TANLAVTIADDNRPLQNIKIAVNGRLIGREELAAVTGPGLRPEKASFTVTGNQKTVNFTLPLVLDPGENLVEVVAYNGFAESRQRTTVTRQGAASPERELPRLWILAVGVNEYESEHIMNLSYCANDAREIVASFKAQEGKRYSQVNALLIADGEDVVPTAQNIRNNLSFLGRAGPRDVILLFLAGHGITGQDGAFYFLPRDTVSDGTVVPGSAISGDEITTVLDAPGNRLIFIDACHSGGVDSDRMTRKLMDTNAFVFTASRGSEYSQERADLEHGVFTYTVIEGLRTGKRSLGMLQLSGEVQLEVPRMTADQQHPSAYSLGFYDFIIGE